MTTVDRPTLEQISVVYDALLASMRRSIDQTRSVSDWETLDEAETSPGDELIAGPRASQKFSEIWASASSIPNDQRDATVKKLNAVLLAAGFGEFTPYVDEPDLFEAVATDMYGAEVRIATSGNAVILRYVTGTHASEVADG